MFRVLLLSLLTLSSVAQARLEEKPKFDQQLEELGISRQYSESGYMALIDRLGERSEELLALNDPDAEELTAYLKDLADTLEQTSDPLQMTVEYNRARQLLYSVETELLGDRSHSFGERVRIALKLFSQFNTRLPHLNPQQQQSPMKASAAKKEAWRLVDTKTGKIYADPESLAGLTPAQVAKLDILPSDAMLFDAATIRSRRLQSPIGSLFEVFEREMEQEVSQFLGRPYSLEAARQLVFFDGIRESATSAKANVRDVYGMRWKAKWGEEVHTEPLVNRLYMEVGGKFTDLVYGSNAGPSETVFVLAKKDAQSVDPSDCQRIATVSKLISCFQTSKYEFDIRPYIARSGTVNEYDLSVRTGLPNGSPELDREYVVFKEVSLEFTPPKKLFDRIGAAAMSTEAALQDRSRRGLAVFSSWIRNRDAKDANNKGLITDRDSSTYIEYMHDLGSSIAGFRSTGSLNSFGYGNRFLRVRNNQVIYRGLVLYQPKSFLAATWADQKWMADRILEVPAQALIAAAQSVPWPAFMQRIYAFRLMKRQEDLAKVFAPETQILALDPQRLALTYNPGSTDQELANLASELGIQGLEVALEGHAPTLATHRLRSEAQRLGVKKPQHIVRIKNGEPIIESCRDSAVIYFLQMEVYPSGLSKRTKRSSDDKPLRCEYGRPRRSYTKR